jgi:hypothetical protein
MQEVLQPDVRALVACAAVSPDVANGLLSTVSGALDWAVLPRVREAVLEHAAKPIPV